jgi:hypothetical protein
MRPQTAVEEVVAWTSTCIAKSNRIDSANHANHGTAHGPRVTDSQVTDSQVPGNCITIHDSREFAYM